MERGGTTSWCGTRTSASSELLCAVDGDHDRSPARVRDGHLLEGPGHFTDIVTIGLALPAYIWALLR